MPRNPKKVITGTDYHPKGWHFNLKIASEFQPSPTITARWVQQKKLLEFVIGMTIESLLWVN